MDYYVNFEKKCKRKKKQNKDGASLTWISATSISQHGFVT